MESHFPDVSVVQSQLARERVIDDLHVLADDTKLLLRAAVNDVGTRASQAGRQARLAAQKTDALIRQNPYQAVGISFAAGVLVGWLLSRRN